MSRIVIISNRLPVSIVKQDHGIQFKSSEGGLATGLGSIYKGDNNLWVGWPGLMEKPDIEKVKERLKKKNLIPVFLNKKDVKEFYEGFSNETLWPIFHYFPQYAKYKSSYWQTYIDVNYKFYYVIENIIKPEDIIWIHDYHLLLLPQIIREKFPNATIGFFQHIPFPSFEIFRLLPWRDTILKGMLGADLIGFHTYDDMRHFLSSVYRLLGIDGSGGQLEVNHRNIIVDAFPMGIDYNKYHTIALSGDVLIHEKKIRSSLGQQKTILSIDRLDYSKGIPQRLNAFELFLQRYPEYKEKVSLVQIVVPSRDKVQKYNELREEVNKLVGNINSTYRTITWTPIIYFYRSFSIDMLSAFYKLADVALVTPMRDGMNLVCKEYIASKLDKRGVLILSEMAGASHELSDAILINPNDINQIVEAIYTSLTLSNEDQSRRMINMQHILKTFNIHHWVKLFLERIHYAKEKQNSLLTRRIDNEVFKLFKQKYDSSTNRLFFLDYDGTLTPFKGEPGEVSPDQDLVDLIKILTKSSKNKVVIISGRDKDTLDKWLGSFNIDIIAEHGAWLKTDKKWHLINSLPDSWKKEILPLMEQYVSRTPRAFIEEKNYSLVWHYRMVERGLGELRTRELVNHLKYLAANYNLHVMEGNKVIEIKNIEVNKGRAALKWLEQYPSDFIITIGDDWTDEDIFQVMPEHAFTVKVGGTTSAAKYNINSYIDTRYLLKNLAAASLVSL